MNSQRIKEIQQETAYPDSVSVRRALLQVWNECEQQNKKLYSEEDMEQAFVQGASTDLFNTWNLSNEEIAKEKFKEWFNQNKKK